MNGTTTRRNFLRVATLTTASLAIGGLGTRRAFAEPATGEKPLYCFPLLGDLHFDRMAHHDLDWVRKEQPGDERQINNYVKVTETLTPRLLEAVSGAVAAAPAAVPFVIQVGDLVEGLCGSKDLATLQFNDTFAAVEAAKFGAPFLITKGNHDITGPGAAEAYDQVLLPWLTKQGKQDITSANYVRRQDDDIFIFFDGYKTNLDWLEETLTKNKARHVFFIVHQPVVPYNARATWAVFGKAKEAEQRARLLTLLGKYRAIVLSGHLHKYSLLRRTVDTGTFTQLAVCSVLRDAEEKVAKGIIAGVDKYGESLVDLEPKFSAATIDERRALLKAEAPTIQHFEYADTTGYAMMKVYADRVEADIFVSLSKEAWKTDTFAAVAATR